MRHFATALVVLALSVPAFARADVAEPKTGVRFPEKSGETSLLGVGLRTKTILKVKVYAIGLYVADSALAGSLKGKSGTDLYRELVWGDFPKEVHLRLVRDVSASQMQESIRDALEKAEKARVDAFVANFGDIKTGEEYVLRWMPGGTLETIANGVSKPSIADKTFAAAVFGIWLGDDPIQDDIKRDLVSRAPALVK
ncbi:MAG TPA: chalcone isomerase family protein [Vicinamibacteria bacterium]|nr:chalcone isomerase family protein [Vicinamibacteria bacterium]